MYKYGIFSIISNFYNESPAEKRSKNNPIQLSTEEIRLLKCAEQSKFKTISENFPCPIHNVKFSTFTWRKKC